MSELTMIEEIKSIAEAQLGDWLGVDAVYQPAAIHHWQEVYDLAVLTAEWERKKLAALLTLTEALRPFVFNEDELFDTQEFQDDELIFMRPNDGNDSASLGWRKDVTFADVRRAANALYPNSVVEE